MILAIDLVWSGSTGWCLWSEEKEQVMEYGEFSVKRSSKGTKTQKDIGAIIQLSDFIQNLVRISDVYDETLTVVYEYTDWHRAGRTKTEYAIERVAQRRLGMAEATLLSNLINLEFPKDRIIGIGANEAKREFGVGVGERSYSKKKLAELFSLEFLRFKFLNDGTSKFLLDTQTGEELSNDISDSFILGYVASKRLHKQRMVDSAT